MAGPARPGIQPDAVRRNGETTKSLNLRQVWGQNCRAEIRSQGGQRFTQGCGRDLRKRPAQWGRGHAGRGRGAGGRAREARN